jgi:ABC-type transport system involved in multi-copper enzyme maturation permease subunit
MSPAAEMLLVAQRELRTNFRSAKGAALLAITLLGGALTAVILSKGMSQSEKLDLSGTTVNNIPAALIAVAGLSFILRATLWLTPLLVLVIGFDAISGELQYRSVRYWTVRARRASLYVGKVMGLWAVVAIVTLVMDLIVWGVFLAHGKAIGDILSTGPALWIVSLPISFAWAAIGCLVGSQFRGPMLSLLVTWACFFGLFILAHVGVGAFQFLYPNTYEDWMLADLTDLTKLQQLLGDAAHTAPSVFADDPKRIAIGACGCVALGLAVTAAGAFGFTKRDL